jgi:hypothetical protein
VYVPEIAGVKVSSPMTMDVLEDGDNEGRDLGHVAGLKPFLDPLRPLHARVRRLDAVAGHGRVLVLLVRDQPDLGVPRYQGVQRERSFCNIIASIVTNHADAPL